MQINNYLNRTKLFAKFLIFGIIFGCNSTNLSKSELGLEEKYFLGKFNRPCQEKFIYLTKKTKLSEYQSNIYTLFPKLKTSDTILIKELMWLRADNTIAIWFVYKTNNWRAIDYLEWSKKTHY